MPRRIKYQIDADPQKAIAGLSKQIAKQDEMIGKLQATNRASTRAGKGMDSIISKIGGFVSLAGAIATVKTGLEELADVRRQAAEGIKTEEENLKRLIQISGGSKERFEGYKGTARALAEERGIGYTRALGLVFQGASLGLTNEQIRDAGKFKFFSREIGPLLEAGAGIRAAFGAEAAGGKLDSVVNALLAGAEKSKVSVEQVAGAVLHPAQPIKMLGGTAEETVAAVSVVARGLKSIEAAETSLGALGDLLRLNRQFKGRTLLESVEMLADMPKARFEAVVGKERRSSKAAGILVENLDFFRDTLEEVNRSIAATGTAQSRINMSVALAGGVSPVMELTRQMQAQAKREVIEREKLGRPELSREAVISAVYESLAEGEVGWLGRLRARWNIVKGSEWFMPTPQELAEFSVREFRQPILGLGRADLAARLQDRLTELGFKFEENTRTAVDTNTQLNTLSNHIAALVELFRGGGVPAAPSE